MKRVCCLLLLVGCTRTGLDDQIDCGEGALAIVNNNAFCIHLIDRDPECPEDLPFIASYAGATFCSVEETPADPLLAAALQQIGALGDAQVGELPDAAPDATIDASL